MTAYGLPAWHVEALQWFEDHAGQDFAARPFDVGLSVKLTSLQRGIWKPSATVYSLSVVQTHKGVYDDQDPVFFEDGTWEYFYHQEGKTAEDLRDPERLYANAGLFKCMRDGVPVGVLIPATSGQGYHVLGLAMVNSYASGFFGLIGPVSIDSARQPAVAESSRLVSATLVELPLEEFDPNAQEDSRLKVVAAVHRRQGAPRFRRALLSAYDGHCAMTRYDAPPALEAAHIVPYRGPQTNHVANGLLLRADMHDLFDLGLLAVDSGSMTLLMADALAGTQYEQYAGQPLWLPREAELRPNEEALDKHRAMSAVA